MCKVVNTEVSQTNKQRQGNKVTFRKIEMPVFYHKLFTKTIIALQLSNQLKEASSALNLWKIFTK